MMRFSTPVQRRNLFAVILFGLAAGSLRAENEICPSWLVSRVFAGVGGFSLDGIDAEADLRPSEGDPYACERYDAPWPNSVSAHWEVRKPDARGVVQIEAGLPDLTWSRGTGYAHLYFRSSGPNPILFHLSQNGTSSVVWCDGVPIPLADDPNPAPFPAPPDQALPGSAVGTTDQGNKIKIQISMREKPKVAVLPTSPGWHSLLVKLTTQSIKGDSLLFTGDFSDGGGFATASFETTLNDPDCVAPLHSRAALLTPLVETDAPFNLVHTSVRPLHLSIVLEPAAPPPPKGAGSVPAPTVDPFPAIVQARFTDYDGKEIGRTQAAATLPGSVSLNFGAVPAPGYYGVHLALVTPRGKPIMNYPPDGFSVIGGTAAQAARKTVKKMAVTYYFMSAEDRYKTLFFPYMRRIGIYRNVGGSNVRAPEFYKEAHEAGLLLAADFWDNNDPAYTSAYVQETAPYVDSYKSYNEIDIAPAKKKTAQYWVNRERMEYGIVKQFNPSATVLGGSLVRVGNDPWFEECLKLGLDQYQDVWDVHAYPKFPPKLEGDLSNSSNESDLGIEEAYHRLGRTNDKPFWMGETGARCSHGSDGRRWQADMVTKMTAWALSRSDFRVIGFLIPWGYSREKGQLNDIETGHMPAEAAYYTASALIDGFPYRRLPTAPEVQAAQFGRTTLVWSTNGPQSVRIPVPGPGPWVRVDVVGRTSPLKVDADGTVTVTATESPFYLLSQATYEQLTAFAPGEAAP